MAADPSVPVRRVTGDRVDAAVLYALLTLRVDVFVVEQQAAYRELDGADLLAGTTHLWIETPGRAGHADASADARAAQGADRVPADPAPADPADGPPIAGTDRRLVAAARLLTAGGNPELGRVVVAGALRRRGLGAALVRVGCELGGRPLHVNAQAHLEAWYAQFGFATVGPSFDWDGIPHLPMRLDR